MDGYQNNISMTSTRNKNVSPFRHFMDTFCGRVHAVGMNGRNQSVRGNCTVAANNLEELGYGG
jgi:hypothetical protein